MTTALVTTDPSIGPWVIPSKGQNLIINFYAQVRNIKIDTVIPEPLFSDQLSTTRWTQKNKGLSRILLTSYHQFNLNLEDELRAAFQDIELHFVMEELAGKGEKFLDQIFNELRLFKGLKTIPYKDIESYQDLQNILQNY